MTRESLDKWDVYPEAMISYLRHYGWHFNARMAEYAVSLMRKKDTTTGKLKRVEGIDRSQLDEMLKNYGVELENDILQDAVYVANMGRADYLGSSVEDEPHLAKYVKDVIDDVDACDGEVFAAWYARMVRKGIPIDWEEML